MTLSFDANKLANEASEIFAEIQMPLQSAMAEQFKDIVMSNFGASGVDRPYPWPPLSDRSEIGRAYIRKVGRSYATLYETGLMASAVRQEDELFQSNVSLSDVDCPYATIHHEGKGNVPMRRVFPILTGGQITDFTMEAVIDAAKQDLTKVMK